MNTVVCYRMKPSHSNFELIPEEDQEQYYSEHNMDQVFKKEATAAAAAAAAAQQAALAARIFQAQQQQQQQQQSTTTTNSAELSLHQQLFSQQLLHQKILEEQFAVAASAAASRAGGRDFLLMSEADREKQLGIIFQQVSFYHFYIGYNIERSIIASAIISILKNRLASHEIWRQSQSSPFFVQKCEKTFHEKSPHFSTIF